MCLAIPGQIKSVLEAEPPFRSGRVDFSGIVKEINLAFVPEAGVGDYVLVHAGTAISRVDEDEAQVIFEYAAQMDELDGLRADKPGPDEPGKGA